MNPGTFRKEGKEREGLRVMIMRQIFKNEGKTNLILREKIH